MGDRGASEMTTGNAVRTVATASAIPLLVLATLLIQTKSRLSLN